jgi:hypothetical protein
MLACLSFIGAVIVTIVWMIGASYLDYFITQRRRRSNVGHQSPGYRPLAIERLFVLPWDWPGWLTFGAIVLFLMWLSGLFGFSFFVLVNLIGLVVLTTILFSDWQQLQRRQTVQPMAWLLSISGQYAGQRFQLNNYGFTIGRSTDNTLRLSSRAISRRHAQIRYAQGRYFLQDLGSQRGTYLNGQRIDASTLRDGDQITLCDTVFEFRTSTRQ